MSNGGCSSTLLPGLHLKYVKQAFIQARRRDCTATALLQLMQVL